MRVAILRSIPPVLAAKDRCGLSARRSNWQPGARKVCVALGMFDGVHLGHKRVLATRSSKRATRTAVSVAITFDRHPNSVVAPGRTPPLIYSVRQRLRAIEALGLTRSG